MSTELLGVIITTATSLIIAVITLVGQIIVARIKARDDIVARHKERGEELPSDEEINRQLEQELPSPQALIRASLPTGIAVGVLVLALGLLFTLWLWPILARKPPTSPDALLYSFEAKDIAPEWVILNGKASLSRSSDHAFAGRYSLRVDVDLKQRQIITDPTGVVQLGLRGRDIRDKVVTYRVYAPDQVPTNLRASLYILDKDSRWRNGPYIEGLPVSRWSTLVWATQDAANWEPPAEIGVEFSLLPATEASDRPEYSGPVYIDLVEILTLLDVHADRSSLDNILELLPSYFYDFEDATQVPEDITRKGNTSAITVTDEESLSDGQHSLKLDLELEPYDYSPETGWGGIYVDLGGVERVEAMTFSILVPDQSNARGGNFSAFFLAVDDKGGWVYSGSRPVPVGKWSSQFWGTRYAYNGPILCPDRNKDDQCDEPAETWWYGWYETDIKGFYVRVIRSGEGYQGPVYIDNLAVYQLRR
jgi:hypothetical protein